MKKHGKKYRAAIEKVEEGRKYNLDDAVKKLKEIAFAKFDETVELTIWLGVDPRKADQLVRGTIVLPHGLGKNKTVVVIAQGDKIREAEEAGALCNCCAGCGEAGAPSAAFGGFGPPGGGIVPGVEPPVGSPGGRCAGACGVVWVPASSARSFSHAW